MMAARSASGTNRALKSSPDIAATLRAWTGWQPRWEPPFRRPQEVRTRRRICLSAPVQYPSSAALAMAAPGALPFSACSSASLVAADRTHTPTSAERTAKVTTKRAK